MLSVDSPALTIFGQMGALLIDVAKELAKISRFPVIVRRLEEDPSLLFTDTAGENATHADQSGSRGRRNHNPVHSPEKKGKQRESDGHSDDDEGMPLKKITHRSDVEVTLSDDNRPEFIRVITSVTVGEYLIYVKKVR